jgi:hypothetical protein
VTGIISRGASSVPWESELRRLRSYGAAPERIAECQRRAAEQIVAATRDTPPDTNLARQIFYYSLHRNLRFANVFDSTPAVGAL